jgi:cell division protease FtsH
VDVPFDGKNIGENFKDKLSSLLGFQAPQRKEKGLPPKAHFSIWYFVIVFLLFTLLQQYLLSPKVETIPYSKFKQYLAEGQVSSLTIGPENITGTDKGKRGEKGSKFHRGSGGGPQPGKGTGCP